MNQTNQATLLVVDDDEASLHLMETLLAAEGHAVRTAASGEEALAAVAAQPPDMILLDIMLPGIDGFEVTRRLKAYSSTHLIPIILITALEGRESRLVGLQAGADEFIAKPVDRTELLVRVRTLLKLKEYNAALQSSKEQFRKIAESAQDAIIKMGPDQRISFWNAAAARIFGYTVAEAMGQELHALVAPAAAHAKFSQAFPHFQETGEGPIIGSVRELTALRKGGEEFPVELSVSTMQLNGQWHAIGIVRDITERKQREMESQKLIAIIDSTDDAILSKSLDGVIQSWNHGAEQIFGYKPAEIIGKPMLILIPPDRLDEEPEILSRISRGEKIDHFETVRQCKDGRLINISATISPIFDSHGKVVGISKIAHDITVRKQAEEQIRQLAFYDTLTQLPNRRLLNDRLEQTMAASKRSGRYGALLFMDLDNFKPLNDAHGHDVGDLLLIEVAHRLTRCVREVDTVARFGGDEFLVMLGELDMDKAESATQAGIVAEKIRAALAEPYILKLEREAKTETTVEHHCTSSIGVVLFINHAASTEEIIKWADMAMYQAKEAGRNLIRFYDQKV